MANVVVSKTFVSNRSSTPEEPMSVFNFSLYFELLPDNL